MVIVGTVAGLLVGAIMGAFTMALMVAAGEENRATCRHGKYYESCYWCPYEDTDECDTKEELTDDQKD